MPCLSLLMALQGLRMLRAHRTLLLKNKSVSDAGWHCELSLTQTVTTKYVYYFT